MSLSATRLAAAISAELQAAGFAVEDGPKLGSTGKTGVKVMVEALAGGIVIELNGHWDGEGGTGGGDEPIVYVQSSPSTAWVIPNPFGRPPVGLQVFDSANQPGGADVENASDWSQIIVRVSNAMTGTVVFS